MANKPAKRKLPAGTSGRVTPKAGSVPRTSGLGPKTGPSPTSGRYTPPIPKEFKVSPMWVPALMFTLLGLGVVVIILNYIALLPTWGFLPDDTSNLWLLVGLGLILAGIIVATQWH